VSGYTDHGHSAVGDFTQLISRYTGLRFQLFFVPLEEYNAPQTSVANKTVTYPAQAEEISTIHQRHLRQSRGIALNHRPQLGDEFGHAQLVQADAFRLCFGQQSRMYRAR
jgi:hypothetical protein